MWPLNGSVGWSDAGILIPYRFSKIYGNQEILPEYYDRMKKYAEFMDKRCGKNGFLSKPLGVKGEAKKYAVNFDQSYGEWAEPKDMFPNDWKDMIAPHPEVSTAYTAYVMRAMAEDLHRTRDAAEFVKERLIKALDNYGWRLGTGFLSTPLILDVLAEYDPDAAYRLLENEEMPGWLFMPKHGASTVWESWEGTLAQGGIASLNHYSKGAVCEWLFKTMCGIRVDGENHFTVAPVPGGSFTHASAAYNSIYGRIESGWKRGEDKIVYTITIPANTTAEIVLPGASARTVTAGTYTYTVTNCS